MILKGTFYQLIDLTSQDNQLIATIKLNENDTIFEGHFPKNPVTPGVAQLEIIKEILSTHYDRCIQLKSISNCKYLAILDPRKDSLIKVSITVSEVENQLKVSCNFASEATIFTKVQGIYY